MLANELIKTLKNITSKTVTGDTLGEVLENFNLQYEPVNMTFIVVDEAGEDIDAPTVVLKKGAVVGSGDTVTAETDGSYNVLYGQYNISVSKTGYTTKTAVITIGYDDARKKIKTVSVTLITEG